MLQQNLYRFVSAIFAIRNFYSTKVYGLVSQASNTFPSRCFIINNLCQLYFAPFAAISLCGVAGLADTFPSFPVGGSLLPDVPGFQVSPDSIFPPQLWSSRALPLHLHFNNCLDVLSFISSFDVPEPFEPSPSHNHAIPPCQVPSHEHFQETSSFQVHIFTP